MTIGVSTKSNQIKESMGSCLIEKSSTQRNYTLIQSS
jgi:hypothetical protein